MTAAAGGKIDVSDLWLPTYVQEVSDTSTITTVETVVGTLTFAATNTAVYETRWSLKTLQSVAGDWFLYQIRENSVSGAILDAWGFSTGTATFSQQLTIFLHYTASASGTKSLVITLSRLSGSGNIIRNAKSNYSVRRSA